MNASCFIFALLVLVSAETNDSYMQRRAEFIELDSAFRYGNSVHLSPAEETLNRMILGDKAKDIADAIQSEVFPPAEHFFHVKNVIEQTKIFKIIKSMPKGAVLHAHLISMIDPQWLIEHATYRPDCYICFNNTGPRFRYAKQTPTIPGCRWRLASDVRNEYPSPQAFDQELRSNLTILTDTPQQDYPTQRAVWLKAGIAFTALADLVLFKPILVTYCKEVLRQYLADGVQYLEMRGSLYGGYDYSGQLDAETTLLLLRNAVQEFKNENPEFIGAKFISEKSKYNEVSQVSEAVRDAVNLHRKYPDFLAGFDLVSQEDATKPIVFYLDALLMPSQMDPPYKLPYFFHAGETNWEGTSIDDNLFDAILLNTTRIGHGYAVVKHPVVLSSLKLRDVAIEINPVSNQVLLLVGDLRNHPAAQLMANNYSITVSSDDAGLWGALPLSHDVYELFMACTPMDQGLQVLKRLAMDSIRYAALTPTERAIAMTKWMRKWDEFVFQTLTNYRRYWRDQYRHSRFINAKQFNEILS